MKRLLGLVLVGGALAMLGGCYYPTYRPGVVYDDGARTGYAYDDDYYDAGPYYSAGYYPGYAYGPYYGYGYGAPWIGVGFYGSYYGGHHYYHGGGHGNWHGGSHGGGWHGGDGHHGH